MAERRVVHGTVYPGGNTPGHPPENFKLEEKTTPKLKLADELSEIQIKYNALFSELEDLLYDNSSETNIIDIYIDFYDNSIELKIGPVPIWIFPEEKLQNLWDAGFERLYINYQNGREELHLSNGNNTFINLPDPNRTNLKIDRYFKEMAQCTPAGILERSFWFWMDKICCLLRRPFIGR